MIVFKLALRYRIKEAITFAIFTDHVRSTREGNVFRRVFPSVHGRFWSGVWSGEGGVGSPDKGNNLHPPPPTPLPARSDLAW